MPINHAVVCGNLVRDGELVYTQTGEAVLDFSVAFDERRMDRETGEWTKVPNFISCAVFGARAESLAPYMTKGRKVAVQGRLRWSQWEKDGLKRAEIDMLADEIEFAAAPPRVDAEAEQFIKELGGKPVEYFEEEIAF